MKRNSGFTLTELIVTIAIVAILMAFAIPNFRTLIQNYTQSTQANNLVFALNYARSEAVKQDARINICASPDGATCSAGATNWAIGWMVFSGTTATPNPLQSWPALASGTSLTTRVGGVATAVTPIVFQPSGLTYLSNGATSTASIVSFIFCDSRKAPKAVDVELRPTGRVETSLTPGYGFPTVSGNAAPALICP